MQCYILKFHRGPMLFMTSDRIIPDVPRVSHTRMRRSYNPKVIPTEASSLFLFRKIVSEFHPLTYFSVKGIAHLLLSLSKLLILNLPEFSKQSVTENSTVAW